MKDGWVARYEDGSVIRECDRNWKDVEIDKVVQLCLFHDGRVFRLPSGKRKYIQGKGASANLDGSGLKILSRYIGFDENGKRTILRVTIDTGDCSLEIMAT